MDVLGWFEDDQYPVAPITYERLTVRCLLQDEQGRYIFVHVLGTDEFGKRDYIESIGGGVEENESLMEALSRECQEEAGCTLKEVELLGLVVDHYHLIQRRTYSIFFKAKVDTWLKHRHLTEAESNFGLQLQFYSYQEALHAMNPKGLTKINKLIQQRDYCVLQHVITKG